MDKETHHKGRKSDRWMTRWGNIEREGDRGRMRERLGKGQKSERGKRMPKECRRNGQHGEKARGG